MPSASGLRPPCPCSTRGTVRARSKLTSSPTTPGGHSRTGVDVEDRDAVDQWTQGSLGVSGVRAMATPALAFEPKPSTTRTEPGGEAAQIPWRTLVPVGEPGAGCRHRRAPAGGQDVGQRFADVVGVGGPEPADVGEEARRGTLRRRAIDDPPRRNQPAMIAFEMEQRHRQVTDVRRAEAEPLGNI